MQALSEDLLDGAAAAAAFLGLKQRTIYNLTASGDLPVIRKGGKLFYRKSELEEAFKSETANVPAAG